MSLVNSPTRTTRIAYSVTTHIAPSSPRPAVETATEGTEAISKVDDERSSAIVHGSAVVRGLEIIDPSSDESYRAAQPVKSENVNLEFRMRSDLSDHSPNKRTSHEIERLSQYQFGAQLAADGVAQDIDRATKRTRHDDQESSSPFSALFDAASSLLQGVESERRAAYGIGNPSPRTTQRPLVPPLQSQSYGSTKTTTAPVLASPLTGSTQKGRLSLGLDRTNLTSSNGSQADSGRITPSVDVDSSSILMKRRTTGSTLKSLTVQTERSIGQIIASNSPLHSATPSSNQIHFSGPNIRCAEVSRSNSVVALPPCRPMRDSLEARRIAIEKANFSSVSRASTSSGIPGSASANHPSPQFGSYFFKPLSTTSTAKSNHISPVGPVLPTPALTGTLPSFEEYHRHINLQRQSAQPQPQNQPLPQSHRPSQHQDPHGRPLAHYPGQTPHVIPRAIDQKAAFLSLFSTFYDSLTDSRVLTRTLEDQIRRGDVLIRDLEMGQRDLARMRREFEEDRAKFIQQSSRSE